MSRIGKKPISIEGGTSVSVNGSTVTVQKGDQRLSLDHRREVTVKVEDSQVVVERVDNSRTAKAMHGLTRALIADRKSVV